MTSENFISKFCGTFAQNVLAGIIQQGPMPKHVAIIMDGNRRYARKMGYKTAVEGHQIGEKTLTKILDVFATMGVEEITVYSFSSENFKRTEEEVKGLMDLFTVKMEEWYNDLDTLNRKGIGFEVVGDYTKAPTPHLRHLFAKLMLETKANKKFQVNIAFAYTGREEIAKGLQTLMNGLTKNQIHVDDVDESLVDQVLTVRSSTPVDLLIRTGGDSRLSDFMMWQCGNAYLYFLEDVTWPEFSYWHVAQAIFRYQMQLMFGGVLESVGRKDEDDVAESGERAIRRTLFLSTKNSDEWRAIEGRAAKAA